MNTGRVRRRRARGVLACAGALLLGCGSPERPQSRHADFETFLADAPTAGARRVALVGIDGASWSYLEPLLADGSLPNLARVVEEGAFATLRSVECHFTPPAWTTLFTGVLPARHGVYTFGRWDPERRAFANVGSNDVRVPALWELASRAGRRVAAVGVPVTYPAVPIEGVMVSGLMTPKRHGPPLALRPRPQRPALPDPELVSFSPVVSAAFDDTANVFLARFHDASDDGVARPDHVRLSVLRKGFGPPQRRLLGVHDFALGDYSPWLRVRVVDGAGPRDAWVRARFELPEDAGVSYRLSPTFERITSPFTHPPELAAELERRFGYYLPHEFLSLELLPAVTADAAGHARYFLAREPWDLFLYVFGQSDNAHHLVGFAESVLPVYREIDAFVGELLASADDDTLVVLASDHGFGPFEYAVDPNQLLARHGLLHWAAPGAIDHERTLVFHNLWHLYFSPSLLVPEELERRGVELRAGETPRAALQRHLVALFRDLRADDGRPFPVEVEGLPEDAVGDAPDMAVRGSPDFWIEFWNVDRPSGAIVRPLVGDERWKHASEGILAFWGRGVRPGHDLGVRDIQDVTPTLLDLMGLPVADDLDGRRIPDVLEPRLEAARVLHRVPSFGARTPPRVAPAETGPSFEETLRALGYLRD